MTVSGKLCVGFTESEKSHMPPVRRRQIVMVKKHLGAELTGFPWNFRKKVNSDLKIFVLVCNVFYQGEWYEIIGAQSDSIQSCTE